MRYEGIESEMETGPRAECRTRIVHMIWVKETRIKVVERRSRIERVVKFLELFPRPR